MKIKEQLQLAIEEAEYEEYPHSAIYKLDYNKAVDGCFEITKNIAIKFAEWRNGKMYDEEKGINGKAIVRKYYPDYYKQLFEEFLKTL